MNKKDSRRKLLKSVAVGGGAVVAGKAMPESWSKPVVNAVMLPAHAATTDDTDSEPAQVTGTIICSSLILTDGKCGKQTMSFSIAGDVSASDGSSLEGVSLTVTYSNETFSTTTPPPSASVPFTVLVGANNEFASAELIANAPPTGGWNDPFGTVSVKFTDPKYGSSSCSVPYDCGER